MTSKTPDGWKTLQWDRQTFLRFKAAYVAALTEKGRGGVFTFEGDLFLVSYAGYLIQHLHSRFQEETP